MKNTKQFENTKTSNIDSARWNWPDSLDALEAAGEYHKMIFETSDFRLLDVTVTPGQLDPIHTHKGKSIIWVVSTSPFVYNSYGLDVNGKLTVLKRDTINITTDKLNTGFWEKPEGPHSIENIGNDVFKLYRIEYKKATITEGSN